MLFSSVTNASARKSSLLFMRISKAKPFAIFHHYISDIRRVLCGKNHRKIIREKDLRGRGKFLVSRPEDGAQPASFHKLKFIGNISEFSGDCIQPFHDFPEFLLSVSKHPGQTHDTAPVKLAVIDFSPGKISVRQKISANFKPQLILFQIYIPGTELLCTLGKFMNNLLIFFVSYIMIKKQEIQSSHFPSCTVPEQIRKSVLKKGDFD